MAWGEALKDKAAEVDSRPLSNKLTCSRGTVAARSV